MDGSYPLRNQCACGSSTGYIIEKNGQDVVRCVTCDNWDHNAPRVETGRAIRSVSTRPTIKPKRRFRLLERDGNTCVSCHRGGVPLHLGHLISVEDGHQHGIPDELIWHDWNLAPFCDECNLGLGRSTVAVHLMWRCLMVRLAQEEGPAA
jgi:5-methylcytosine-specific restriction endonuclease McrA